MSPLVLLCSQIRLWLVFTQRASPRKTLSVIMFMSLRNWISRTVFLILMNLTRFAELLELILVRCFLRVMIDSTIASISLLIPAYLVKEVKLSYLSVLPELDQHQPL
jgi:hypothetical protein